MTYKDHWHARLSMVDLPPISFQTGHCELADGYLGDLLCPLPSPKIARAVLATSGIRRRRLSSNSDRQTFGTGVASPDAGVAQALAEFPAVISWNVDLAHPLLQRTLH